MEYIFHEKVNRFFKLFPIYSSLVISAGYIYYEILYFQQEGRLCAQHCLNSLLQGPYFTPVELGDLAQTIDRQERDRMAECGTESDSYRQFVEVCVCKNNN